MKNPPARIMIIGCSGSGKSTLAKRLAKRTGLPVIHLDENYFGPNWKEPTTAAWVETVKEIAARDRWIMDGNFSGTFPYRLPRADAIVFLNEPTWKCLYRVIKRTLRYWHQIRPGSAPGCHERFDWHFLRYVYHYNITRRKGILRTLAEQEKTGKQVYVLSGSKSVNDFLSNVLSEQ